MKHHSFKWIDTTGGPMILLPQFLLPFWSGCFSVQSIQAGDIVDLEKGDNCDNPETCDFAKVALVCGNEEGQDVGFFEFKGLQHLAITFWDDPKLWTTVIQESPQKIYIIRNSNKENGIAELLNPTQLRQLRDWKTEGELVLEECDYVLFDAATLTFCLEPDDRIDKSLEKGVYQVKTMYFDEYTEPRLFWAMKIFMA
jgi:hypothetical protein